MALAGITTLLSTPGGPHADQQGTTGLGQLLGLASNGDVVGFDEELLAILLPFTSGAGPAGVFSPPNDPVTPESVSELDLLGDTAQLSLDERPDASHFALTFGAPHTINQQQVPTNSTEQAVELPTEPANIAQLPPPLKTVEPPKAPTSGSSDGVAEAIVEQPLNVAEDTIQVPQSDVTEVDANEPVSLDRTTQKKPASTGSESSLQTEFSVPEEQQSHTALTPDDMLDAPDQPDAPVTPQKADSATNATTNPAFVPMHASAANHVEVAADLSVVDAPNLAEQIATEAVKHAEVVKHQGQQRFTMRLDPPELGKLVVEMERTDQGLTMRVNAVDPVTLGLIQSSLEELNTSLSQQDSVFQEVNIDVTTGGEFERSLGDRSSHQSERKGKQHALIDSPENSKTGNDQDVDFVA